MQIFRIRLSDKTSRLQRDRGGRGLFLSFVVFDELFEVFNAFARERRRRLIDVAPNDKASVFRFHL
jgi:hypothetical protein